MKKQMYFVSGILVGILMMIALSTQTANAEEFKFMPATTDHIMMAAKSIKVDNTLGVSIIGYSEKIEYQNIDDLAVSVRVVEEAFLYVNIDLSGIVIEFANKKGLLEEKYKFKTGGVCIQLFRR